MAQCNKPISNKQITTHANVEWGFDQVFNEYVEYDTKQWIQRRCDCVTKFMITMKTETPMKKKFLQICQLSNSVSDNVKNVIIVISRKKTFVSM